MNLCTKNCDNNVILFRYSSTTIVHYDAFEIRFVAKNICIPIVKKNITKMHHSTEDIVKKVKGDNLRKLNVNELYIFGQN